MNLKKSFISGVFWEGVKKYFGYGLTIVVTAILARLLTPSDFGIIAMVMVYNGFVQTFAESGINSAVIQKKHLTREDLSTVFWFSVMLGLAFVLLTLVLAPYIEVFFDSKGLNIVLMVMSIDLFLISIKAVPYGLLRRELKFNLLAYIQISALVISSTVAVYMAYTGWGYWALVAKILLANGLTVLPLFWFSYFLPKFKFSKQILHEVLSYSLYLVGFRSINYWARNADNLLVGKYLGSDSLGFYSQAYRLLMMPISMLTGILNPVMHPIFSNIKHEKKRMGDSYLKILQVIAILSFPLGAFLFFTAHEIIVILWGAQWEPSVPVFKILAVLTLFQPLISTTGGMLMATDNEKLLFNLGIINTLFMVGGMLVGLPYGIEGIALGYTISYLVFVMPITFHYLFEKLEISWANFISILTKPVIVLILVAGSLGLLQYFMNSDLSIWFVFLLNSIIYGLFTTYLVYSDLKEDIQNLINKTL